MVHAKSAKGLISRNIERVTMKLYRNVQDMNISEFKLTYFLYYLLLLHGRLFIIIIYYYYYLLSLSLTLVLKHTMASYKI